MIYHDNYFGGHLRWYDTPPKDANMYIRDDLKTCIGFLVTKRKEHKRVIEKYEGTAFFVCLPSETNTQVSYVYLLTARHILDDARKENNDELPNFYLRLNTVDGKRDDISLSDHWQYPQDPAIDVAVLPISPPDHSYFRYVYLPYESPDMPEGERNNIFADQKVIESWKIGIGDELRVLGLFSARAGEKRNIPIVRSGIIAAMPDEPIETEVKGVKKRFNAYLAELRSIGGLSGSPVFAFIEYFRKPRKEGEGKPYLLNVGYLAFLLGVIRGHWDYQVQTSFTGVPDRELRQVNMGMAYITPIEEFLNVLLRGDMKKLREDNDRRLAKQTPYTATEDSTGHSATPENEGVTREGFEEALRRASRKTSSQPEKEKSD